MTVKVNTSNHAAKGCSGDYLTTLYPLQRLFGVE